MSSIKTSLHIGETLTFNDGKLEKLPNKCSGKFIGEVTIDEYDAYGRKLYTETTYNDITLPGSVFILEKMFGITSDARFFHPTSEFPIAKGGSNTASIGQSSGTSNPDIVFGFMAGIGGENGSGVVAPSYTIDRLTDGSTNTFIPFITESKLIKEYPTDADTRSKYTFGASYGGETYYYVKKFDTNPTIVVAKADGSGNITGTEPLSGLTSTPILAYTQCVLKIDKFDLREYFGTDNSGTCHINQIGLVSGVAETINENVEYHSVRLVTCVNFKSRDLSNNENTLEITYRLYCV